MCLPIGRSRSIQWPMVLPDFFIQNNRIRCFNSASLDQPFFFWATFPQYFFPLWIKVKFSVIYERFLFCCFEPLRFIHSRNLLLEGERQVREYLKMYTLSIRGGFSYVICAVSRWQFACFATLLSLENLRL